MASYFTVIDNMNLTFYDYLSAINWRILRKSQNEFFQILFDVNIQFTRNMNVKIICLKFFLSGKWKIR